MNVTFNLIIDYNRNYHITFIIIIDYMVYTVYKQTTKNKNIQIHILYNNRSTIFGVRISNFRTKLRLNHTRNKFRFIF